MRKMTVDRPMDELSQGSEWSGRGRDDYSFSSFSFSVVVNFFLVLFDKNNTYGTSRQLVLSFLARRLRAISFMKVDSYNKGVDLPKPFEIKLAVIKYMQSRRTRAKFSLT